MRSLLKWRTGTPFSAYTGVDSNLDGQFSDKPVLNGDPLLRNSFRQPNVFKQDLRVTKNFKIREEHNLALIFEMFNLWNTDNLSYDVNINEQGSSTSLGSLWGTGQTPLATFRTLRFPDGTLNTRSISFGLPFQLQVAAKYTF